ncbi:hypothetical protein Zmor_005904 [Zophobas morio]|uniref:PiggyBac transposable element-derived protein domain-containing protein n=1 Tax=Zophobas morio TaxID=2755281 RepID=A0AA38MMD2_9CUCU|nr:hypothetical protein Zmor_005904 [Zophobas morio]
MKNYDLTPKEKIGWRKGVKFITPLIRWFQSSKSPGEVLESPMYFFNKYFTDDLYQMMGEFTNLYAIQNHQKLILTTTQELKTFVGIHIPVLMGNLHYPRLRFYWDSKRSVRIPIVADNVPK